MEEAIRPSDFRCGKTIESAPKIDTILNRFEGQVHVTLGAVSAAADNKAIDYTRESVIAGRLQIIISSISSGDEMI